MPRGWWAAQTGKLVNGAGLHQPPEERAGIPVRDARAVWIVGRIAAPGKRRRGEGPAFSASSRAIACGEAQA
jgi:hypothetical protein